MAFRDFLLWQIKQRDMSVNAFAEFVGLSHTTILRCTAKDNPTRPGLEMLLKLSEKLRMPVSLLIEIAYPEAVQPDAVSAEARSLAQQIENLPDDKRKLIYALLQSLTHTEDS